MQRDIISTSHIIYKGKILKANYVSVKFFSVEPTHITIKAVEVSRIDEGNFLKKIFKFPNNTIVQENFRSIKVFRFIVRLRMKVKRYEKQNFA